MPSATITLPDGRRARLEGPTREAVLAKARALVGMSNPADDPDDMAGLRRMAFGVATPSTHTPRAPVSLPLIGQVGTVGGGLANAVRALSSVPLETSLPLAAATIGSVAGGPVGGTAARGLAARMLTSAPVRQTVGAGLGGAAAGGALEAENPDATAGDIARRALSTGGQMAAAELMGAGIGNLASRAIAPRIAVLDPLSPIRRQLNEFIAEVPEHTRTAARRVEELLPTGAAASARSAAETVKAAADRANEIFRGLVSEQTRKVRLPNARATAERAARAIGAERARRFGFNAENTGPRSFISRVFEAGDAETIAALKKRLGSGAMRDAMSLHLAQLIERATTKVNGRRVLDGEKLLSGWRGLPEATRRLYDRSTAQAVESLATFGTTLNRAGRFAASPVGGEVIEAAAMPAITATFGLGVGIPLLIARALISPGPVVRYLTRDSYKLPHQGLRLAGDQAVKSEFRRGLLDDDEE